MSYRCAKCRQIDVQAVRFSARGEARYGSFHSSRYSDTRDHAASNADENLYQTVEGINRRELKYINLRTKCSHCGAIAPWSFIGPISLLLTLMVVAGIGLLLWLNPNAINLNNNHFFIILVLGIIGIVLLRIFFTRLTSGIVQARLNKLVDREYYPYIAERPEDSHNDARIDAINAAFAQQRADQ